MGKIEKKSKDRLRPGDQMGPYEIVRFISRGGMGEVYEAMQKDLGRKVALKIMTGEMAENSEALIRFKSEGQLLASLQHGNLVTIYSIGQEDDIHYIGMEYIDGLCLSDITKNWAMNYKDALPIFMQLLEGVRVLHLKGIIHRDLKPQNIMIEGYQTVKILDFGIAKSLHAQDNNLTKVGEVVGSVRYLSPEIAKGKKASVQSDIWALGLIFFEILTGEFPFKGRSSFEVIEEIKAKKTFFTKEMQESIPLSVRVIIEKMCAKSVERRYNNIDEILFSIKKSFKISFFDIKEISFLKFTTIKNKEALIKDLVGKEKYSNAQIKLLLALACKKQEELEFMSDETVVGGDRSEISISPAALTSSIEVFERDYKKSVSSGVTTTGLTGLSGTLPAQTIELKEDSQFYKVSIAVASVVFLLLIGKLFFSDDYVEEGYTASESSRLEFDDSVVKLVEEEPAPLPEYNVGDVYYQTSKREEIIATDKDTLTIMHDDGSLVKAHKGGWFFGGVFFENSKWGTGSQKYLGGSPNDIFPLKVGKVVKLTSMGRSTFIKAGWRHKITCSVMSYERIKVPAGLFATYRVDCVHGAGQKKSSLWYSPKVKNVIRRIEDEVWEDETLSVRLELEKYMPKVVK